MTTLNNYLPYSYKSFKETDIKYRDVIEYKEVKRYDNISLESVNHRNLVVESFKKLKNDVMGDQKYYKKFFFNEVCLTYNEYHESYSYSCFKVKNELVKFNTIFRVDEWDKLDNAHNIDSRCLTIDIFIKDINIASYKVKVEHIYQLILDIDRITGNYLNNKISDINLDVLPIYAVINENVYTHYDNYKRISKIDFKNIKYIISVLNDLLVSLMLFYGINYHIVETIDNAEYKEISVSNEYAHSIIKDENMVTPQIVPANSDVIRIIKLNMPDYGCVKIRHNTKNVRNSNIVRKMCDYKFQVEGHFHNYWIGSEKKGTRQLITKWVEPYYKNKDKPFKIIKEVKI